MSENAFVLISQAAEMVKSIKEGLGLTSSYIEKTMIKGSEKLYPEDICAELKDIINSMDKVYADLQKPRLKLAFVGTTSAGKSTLVNGLIGEEIAPMERGQMSAGVLRIQNGKDMVMEVHETKNMEWGKGRYDVHSAKDIYDKNMEIMEKYHNAEKENVEAPRIDITLPIAPKNGGIPSSMIEIPDGIELELIDLPGLKTVLDQLNLKVIQDNLVGAFNLIVMNYSNTDDDKIKALLEEIKKTVGSICRNKNALLFILNRVDEKAVRDKPLQDLISRLEKDIKEILELPEDPVIFPMNAQALFYLQSAWGVEETPLIDRGGEAKTVTQIQSFFKDCGKIIDQMEESSREKYDWFGKYTKRNIGDWKKPEIQQLLHWVYEHSGAARFWEALQTKLDKNIGALIINPALGRTVNLLEDFSRRVNNILAVRELDTDEEIRRQQDMIKRLAEEIKRKIKSFKEDLTEDLKKSVENCKEGKVQDIDENIRYAMQFRKMNNVIVEISHDIDEKLFTPVFDCMLDRGEEAREKLENTLLEDIPRQMATDIRRAIGNLISKGYSEEYAKTGRVIRREEREINREKDEEINALRDVQELLLNVFKCVCAAVLNRCRLLLQEKVFFFEEMIEVITSESMEDLAKTLRANDLNEADIASLLVPPAPVEGTNREINITGVGLISDAWTYELDHQKTPVIQMFINALTDILHGKKPDLSGKVYVDTYTLLSVKDAKNQLMEWLGVALKRCWDILGGEMSRIVEEKMKAYGEYLEKSEKQIQAALKKHLELRKENLESYLTQTRDTADQISREAARYGDYQKEILGET